jgi:hypothetical protein
MTVTKEFWERELADADREDYFHLRLAYRDWLLEQGREEEAAAYGLIAERTWKPYKTLEGKFRWFSDDWYERDPTVGDAWTALIPSRVYNSMTRFLCSSCRSAERSLVAGIRRRLRRREVV